MLSLWVAALSLSAVLASRRDDGQEIRSSAGSSTTYTYHVRPTLHLGSNPYHDGHLKLECVVSGPRDARFSLEWRHRNSVAEVTKLKGTNPGARDSVVSNQSSHLIFDPLLRNPSRVGHYWCVVVVDGNEVAASESAALLSPEAYAGSVSVHPIADGTSIRSSAILHLYQRQAQATSPTSTQASTDPSSSDSLKGPLYAILVVVVVFCGVIVVLTISVVLLCHRKCKMFAFNGDLRTRSEHRTNGHDVGPPSQAIQPPPTCSTCEHLPECEPDTEAQTLRPQELDNSSIPATSQPGHSDYSKLAEWTRDMVTVAISPSFPCSPPASCPGPHTIYSMDSSPDGYGGGANYSYQMLQQQADSLTSSISGKSVSHPSSHTHLEPKPARSAAQLAVQMALYGSIDRSHDKDMESVDPRYLGDYERHPEYIPKPLPLVLKAPQDALDTPPVPPQRRQSLKHSHKVGSNSKSSVVTDSRPQNGYELDPRYQGDYERDLHYVPPLNYTKQPPPLDDDDKYHGDYERDPNYIPPPHSLEINATKSPVHDRTYEGEGDVGDLWDSKYEGDYERDPDYMRNKLMLSQQGSAGTHQHHPYAETNTLGEGDLVLTPNHHHGYKALDSTLREPLRHYTQLSIDQVTSCSLSPSNSEL